MHTDDSDIWLWLVVLCAQVFDLSDDAFAIQHFAKDNMLAVKMGGWDGGYKELRAVRA